jgi:hypothetical protein
VVKTDHYSLKYLLDQRLATIPQHQWVSKLMGFDFAVEYKLGASNTVTDALPRRSEEEAEELVALSAPTFMVFDTLRVDLDEVAALRRLRDKIIAGERGDKWQVVDSLITRAGKVYVSADSPQHLPVILSAVHDMGQEGAEKTLHRMRRNFYVSGARSAVQEHVHACAARKHRYVWHPPYPVSSAYQIRIRVGYVSEAIIFIRILLCPDTGIHTPRPALDMAQEQGGGAPSSG